MSYLKVAGINHPSATTGGLAISSGGIVTGGGLDYITSSTFTTASTVSVDGCFTSSYTNYVVIASGVGSTTVGIQIRMRLSGSDASGANYSQQRQAASASTPYVSYATSQTSTTVGYWLTSLSFMSINFFQPALAAVTGIDARGGYDSGIENWNGQHGVSTAYDGFSIIPSTGTITGTVTVFGYRKA